MPDVTDMDLAREFAASNSEPAFAELVRRHINLVYSVALRYVGNAPDAQDVTQAVFLILARKAAGLHGHAVLTGWLYETTRFTAMRFLRAKIRRQFREQEAYMQSTPDEPEADNVWRQLAPLLEEAMTRLSEKERTLLALRFFENRTGAETAALLGIEEWAGRKRVNRALEKLRKFFAQRGVRLSTTAIVGAVSANSVHAAPAGLAKVISAVAMTKGAAASGSTLTLAKGALKLMAWTKVKTAVVAGAVVLLAAGTTTVIVKKSIPSTPASIYRAIFKHPGSRSANLLESAPPTLIFRPTQFPKKEGSGFWTHSGKCVAVNFSLESLLGIAYGGFNLAHVILPDDFDLGNTNYDVLITLPNHQNEALLEEIKKRFGLTAHVETRETDVLLLKVADPVKLQSHKTKGSGYRNYQAGDWPAQKQVFRNAGLAVVAQYAEVGKPIIDRTETKGHYDFDFSWTEPTGLATDAEKPALQNIWSKQLNQVGLELVPSREPVKMLIVEKAN
jgi:uncharacterized protein (TIGR03435 family)